MATSNDQLFLMVDSTLNLMNRAMKALNRTTQSKDDKMYNPGHCMTKDEYIHYKNGLQRLGHIVWELDVEADHSNYATHKDMKHMVNFFYQNPEVWVLASRAEEIKQELLNIMKKSRSSEIAGFCVDSGPTVLKYQTAQYEKLIKKETIYAEKAQA